MERTELGKAPSITTASKSITEIAEPIAALTPLLA
jgi:hypothetical protein